MKSVEELVASVDGGGESPDGLALPLLALWLAKKGRWEDSHNVAQDIATSMGSWIHAHLHRIEGDFGNAGYWYSRAGKPRKSNAEGLDDEWIEIAKALFQS